MSSQIFVRSTGEADIVAHGPNNSLMYYHAMPGAPWGSGVARTGYSLERGPSNGLPPDWIWPLILPAFPEMPAIFSNLS